VPIRPETGHPEFVWPAWRIRSWYIKLAHGRKRKLAEALLDDDDLMSHGYTDAVLDDVALDVVLATVLGGLVPEIVSLVRLDSAADVRDSQDLWIGVSRDLLITTL
jgi:hypothetical protein